jgi:hypothetical protein
MKCISEEGRKTILDPIGIKSHISGWLDKIIIDEKRKMLEEPKNQALNYARENPLEIQEIYLDYETEVICKPKSTFGFVDIVFTYKAKLNRQYRIGSYENWSDYGIFKVIVEVKPELNDLGAAIRQIKTYRQVLNFDIAFMVIVTYSSISKEAIEYLEHEKIRVVRF